MWKATIGIVILALGACGDDPVCSRDGGEACFELPADRLLAYEAGGLSSPAAIGCGEITPAASTMAVTVGGRVSDYDSAELVAGVTLDVFVSGQYDNPIASATTDANGDYSLILASGTPDLLWGKLTGEGVVPQLLHQMWLDLGQATLDVDHTTATPETLDRAARLVDVERDDGLAQLVVWVRDCNRLPVQNAAVVLSRTAGERDFVDGAPVFYSVAGDFPLPVSPEAVDVTSLDGTAVVVNVPLDGDLYVQAWGFPDAAAVSDGADGLVLMSEHAVARSAGASTWVNLWVNQD